MVCWKYLACSDTPTIIGWIIMVGCTRIKMLGGSPILVPFLNDLTFECPQDPKMLYVCCTKAVSLSSYCICANKRNWIWGHWSYVECHFLIIIIYTTCKCLKYVLRQGWHVHLVVHVAISQIIQDFPWPIILVTKPSVIGLVELMSSSRAMNVQMWHGHLK